MLRCLLYRDCRRGIAVVPVAVRRGKLLVRVFSSSSEASADSECTAEETTLKGEQRSRWSQKQMSRAARRTASVPSNALLSSTVKARIHARMDNLQKHQATEHSMRERMRPYMLDSIVAERFFEDHKDEFSSLAARREEIEKMKVDRNVVSTNEQVMFPLAGRRVERATHSGRVDAPLSGSDESRHRIDAEDGPSDRGFYVHADVYTDEYISGSLNELPEDEMTKLRRTTIRYGTPNAVEEIEFQQPGQSADSMDVKGGPADAEETEEEWYANYGTADPSLPTSSQSCVGCGAKFHCKDPSLPGFLPVELFINLQEKSNEENLCRRCYLLKNYDFLLNVNVVDVDYRSMMEHLRYRQEALIVVVADMCDLPASLHSQLPNIIGEHKPMIVVGNKVDLLPPDRRSGYLRHFRDSLRNAVDEAGFSTRFNILHIGLVSAKTGFGVEDLVTNIFLKWSSPRGTLRSDVYLVGCTNVGKSTLFNTLLQSDLCKVRAMDLVDRATTSPWPGTTISLLKFPIMNPSSHKLELRRRRLLANRKWELKEKRMRRDIVLETGDSKFATLQAHVGSSFKELEAERQPISVLALRTQDLAGGDFQEKREEKKAIWNPNLPEFAKGNWCYDTPGTVNDKQVLNLFTLDELVSLLPRQMLLPRTFVLFPQQSLLIGGVARIDILSLKGYKAELPIYLSVFASDRLPVNVMKTTVVDDFYRRHLGSPTLAVPLGDPKRMEKFPKLQGEDLTVENVNASMGDEGAADVVLSSIGWVCVTTRADEVLLRASTPAARGLSLRVPPILPFCAATRGHRIPGSAAFRVKPVEFPVNGERRSRALRKDESLSYTICLDDEAQ